MPDIIEAFEYETPRITYGNNANIPARILCKRIKNALQVLFN